MEEYKKKRIFVTVRCELSRGITAAEIDENGHLIFTMSDGTTADMGLVVGEDGASVTGIERTAVTETSNIYTVTMSDGTQFQFESLAATGAPGKDGADGQDGVSPQISVTDIDGGHRVTITDAEGTKNFDVMDSAGGAEKLVVNVTGEKPDFAEHDVTTDKTQAEIYQAFTEGKTIIAVSETWGIYRLVHCERRYSEFVIPRAFKPIGTIISVGALALLVDDNGARSMGSMGASGMMGRDNAVYEPSIYYYDVMARGEKLMSDIDYDLVTDWGAELPDGAIAWRFE